MTYKILDSNNNVILDNQGTEIDISNLKPMTTYSNWKITDGTDTVQIKDMRTTSSPATAVFVPTNFMNLDITSTYQITASAKPEDTTDTMSYSSSDSSVVTVSSTGLVTAVAEGQAAITVMCGATGTSINFNVQKNV